MPSPPLDLLAGFPQRYKPKDESALSPVQTIVSAALQANSGLAQADVITYRNNLNKLLLTPLEPNNEWAINACYLQVGGTHTPLLQLGALPQQLVPYQAVSSLWHGPYRRHLEQAILSDVWWLAALLHRGSCSWTSPRWATTPTPTRTKTTTSGTTLSPFVQVRGCACRQRSCRRSWLL
jgi:hypothetical protein